MFPILTNRKKMMNTFIIVNATPHLGDSSWDDSMLFHSKKAFLLPSVWPGKEYTGAPSYCSFFCETSAASLTTSEVFL